MKTFALGALAFATIIIGLCVGNPVFAGENQGFKIAAHVVPHASRSCTKNMPWIRSCRDIVSSYTGDGDIDVFPVFFDLRQVGGVEYGILWPAAWGTGVHVSCSDLKIGGISDPGDGVAHTWFRCQEVNALTPGFVWLYAAAAGRIQIVPNRSNGNVGTADCNDPREADSPAVVINAGVGGTLGDDPCGGVPGEDSSWGAIKATYR